MNDVEEVVEARGERRVSALGGRRLAALEAVARGCSAAWERARGDAPDAYLAIAGETIAVDVVAIEGIAEAADLAPPRLRFDRVAQRLVARLKHALSASVPDGDVVIVTITAPIRLPAKTAAALESWIADCLASGPARAEIRERVCGNQVRVRHVRGLSRRCSKIIGFVHNADSDPEVLFDVAQALLPLAGAAADRRPPETFTGERWLVIADQEGLLPVATGRSLAAQIFAATEFHRILMVVRGGRIEALTGPP